MNASRLLIPAALSLLGTCLPAQTVTPGYASNLRTLPDGAATPLVLPDRDAVVWFTGSRLVLADGNGTRDLLAFATPVFGGFALRVDPHHLLFAESSTGGLWLVPLDGASARRLANASFPFDGVLLEPGLVIVSAKTGGFASPDNDLLGLDLDSGALTPLAVLPGASGPVAADAHGLYYATASNAFPAPPGSSEVLFFPRRVVRDALGRRVLGTGDATTVARGFDAAADLAVDAEGDLFVVDFSGPAVLEWSRRDGVTSAWIQYGPTDPPAATLQWIEVAGDPRAAFEPFQPTGDRALVVHEAVFGGASRLRTVAPERPELAVVTTNTAALHATGLPANATALLLIGPRGGAHEVAFRSPTDGLPLFLLPSLRSRIAAVASVTVPASGELRFDLPARIAPPGRPSLAAQIAFVTDGTLGSTPPIALP